MSKFEYPRLPRHEIVEVLKEFQIASVSEADLLRPDPDSICNLYGLVLSRVDSHPEDNEQMEFGALEQLDIPDYHLHSVQLMNLFQKIRQHLEAVDCPRAFTPKDLIKPEPDRTELFIGALLNFQMHRESKLSVLAPIWEELELLEERRLASEARIAQLNADIADYEESRERELPFVQDINSKVKELEQKVSELNKHQMNLKKEIKSLKEEASEMDEKIANADYNLVQSARENAELRSRIVQSPDKLQRALEEKKSVQIETRNAERAAMQSFQDKTSIFEAYAKACSKMSKHFAQIKALQEQVDSAKALDKEVKILKSKLCDEEISDKSLEAKLVGLQSKADQLKETKRQLEKEIALKHEEATKELNNVKLEVESKRRELELRQKRVESLVAEADSIAAKKRIAKEEGEVKMQELYRKSEEIVAEFYKYSKSISDLLPDFGGNP